MVADQDLLAAVERVLIQHADPIRGERQQAYMKSTLPYAGVGSPELKRLIRPILAAEPITSRVDWSDTALTLIDQAQWREQWYVAVQLLRYRSYRPWRDPAALTLFREVVVRTAWWDVVDEVASHLVGEVLGRFRQETTPVMRRWAVDDDMWVRRTAILSQLRHGADTDRELLTDVIGANLADSRYGNQFWIRKAVGWALRQYARTDPQWVREYVDRHGEALSGLSRREALKHLR